MDQPGAKAMHGDFAKCLQSVSQESQFKDALTEVRNRFSSMFQSLSASPPIDVAQVWSLFHEHAQLLPGHVKGLSGESIRSAFVEASVPLLRQTMQLAIGTALGIDEKWNVPNFRSIVLQRDAWLQQVQQDKLDKAKAVSRDMLNAFRQLNNIELGKHLKKNTLVSLVKDQHSAAVGWEGDF